MFIVTLASLFTSCRRHNEEDPWVPHLKHLNNRLKGEWELYKITVDGVDSSTWLSLDSTNIIRFLKFTPDKKESIISGTGLVQIKCYKEQAYIQEFKALITNTKRDTSYVIIEKLGYTFCEGSSDCNQFNLVILKSRVVGLSYQAYEYRPKNSLTINDYYYMPITFNQIKMATSKDLILSKNIRIGGLSAKIEYLFYYKKLK